MMAQEFGSRSPRCDSPRSSRFPITPTTATVISVTRAACEVWQPDGQTLTCELAGDLAKVQRTAVAVGDHVVIAARDHDRPCVTAVLPRRSTLSRPDPMDPRLERVIVANIDDVVIVGATKRPTLKLRLIDRYLVAIQRGGARPVIVVNKIELLSPKKRAALEDDLSLYSELGVPVVLTSALQGEGIDALRQTISGRTCAFVGHSGVGKSSLLNTLIGTQQAAIGDVRRRDGKGRHTTTHSALHTLPDGTHIIDTPGVRAFGLWGLSRDQLRHWFPEFDDLGCRYTDCVHDAEPLVDCGVKRAVDSGEISQVRYQTYLRLLADLPK